MNITSLRCIIIIIIVGRGRVAHVLSTSLFNSTKICLAVNAWFRIQRLFVNYWDTACNSHNPWRKFVHIWCNYINICIWQISKSVKVAIELYCIHLVRVRVPGARKQVIKIIYWPYQLLLWKQKNSGRTNHSNACHLSVFKSDVNLWKI